MTVVSLIVVGAHSVSGWLCRRACSVDLGDAGAIGILASVGGVSDDSGDSGPNDCENWITRTPPTATGGEFDRLFKFELTSGNVRLARNLSTWSNTNLRGPAATTHNAILALFGSS